jgi:hypothetical protein
MKFTQIVVLLFVFLLSGITFGHHNKYHVKRVDTPIDVVGLAKVLKEGHKKAFGVYPSDKRLAVGWAQVALENGQGKIIHNHNLGFINSGKKRPYFIKKHRFKAHKTFLEGATDYWKVVHKLCKSSLIYFDKGQPYNAAQRLKSCGYYGADADLYGKAMIKLHHKAKTKVIPKL